ncbi:MAG: enoyl-CoA hydratase/isomerase family protein [Ilumatobacteraceae bacterium]
MSELDDQIRRTDIDGIITLTFTRDQKLNAVSDHMVAVIDRAVTDLGDHESNRALIITAEGRYFTAGKDIGQMGEHAASGVALRRNYRRLHEVFDEMERIEKPVILAAQGPCLGVGVEMGSSCDFRFATPRTTIGLPEVPVLAVLPGSGGISRFTRLVGPHWARWVAMAGQHVDAELARTIGWIHHIFPEETFHDDVQAWTRELIGLSPEALGLAKIAIDAAVDSDRRTARHIDRMANTQLLNTREHQDKIAAFVARSKRS